MATCGRPARRANVRKAPGTGRGTQGIRERNDGPRVPDGTKRLHGDAQRALAGFERFRAGKVAGAFAHIGDPRGREQGAGRQHPSGSFSDQATIIQSLPRSYRNRDPSVSESGFNRRVAETSSIWGSSALSACFAVNLRGVNRARRTLAGLVSAACSPMSAQGQLSRPARYRRIAAVKRSLEARGLRDTMASAMALPRETGQLVGLRSLNSGHLGALLEEETRSWREELDWDFARSADLVRRYVDMRGLHGAAILEDGAAIGYCYYVVEEAKGLIGDMYVMREHRSVERENSLLGRAVFEISAYPRVERAESQLMLLPWAAGRAAPAWAREHDRNFMRIDLTSARLDQNDVRKLCYFERWSDHYMEAAARLIQAAYAGHLDGTVNDQYRSVEGSRRFLQSIIQYPGCGVFSDRAIVPRC